MFVGKKRLTLGSF